MSIDLRKGKVDDLELAINKDIGKETLSSQMLVQAIFCDEEGGIAWGMPKITMITRSSRRYAHSYDNNWSRAWSEGRYCASPVFWANWFKSRLRIERPLLCNGWLGEIAC